MNDVDHRAEAVRLARRSEEVLGHVYGQSVDAQVLATLAQVHTSLAAQSTTTPPWTTDEVTAMATELRELREAVRQADLHQRGPASDETITIPRTYWATVQRKASS